MAFFRKLLCKIGLHSWGKERKFIQMSSNVVDHSRYCTVCNQVKKWTTPREH